MNTFKRRLLPNAFEAFEEIVERPAGHWWKDLLRRWAPSGSSRPDGLRMALRDNYLNFYLQGQSVARVGLGRNGSPYLSVHAKYAFESHETSQQYVRVEGNTYHHPARASVETYRGMPTLETWIKEAKARTGSEKQFVDQVVGCNVEVIDLEMGLPAFDQRRRAPRIDLVAIEPISNRTANIAFWEVKLADDDRLAARETPKVVSQITDYRIFLGDAERRDNVARQYEQACAILVEIHRMAMKLDPDIPPLAPLIKEVASGAVRLNIDPTTAVRLLIQDYEPNDPRAPARHRHLQRLSTDFGPAIPYRLIARGDDLALYREASCT